MKISKKYNLFIVIALILIVVLCLYITTRSSLHENFDNDVQFQLYNLAGKLINNTDWEYPEQLILKKYIKKTDNVLQLGGNLGASCICVDKITNKDSVNICVEPNFKVIDTLKKNKSTNKCEFEILYGVISEDKNLKLSEEDQNKDGDLCGSKIIDDGTIDVTSYSLKDVSNIDRINVLFADCEGCLESFFDEYEWFLKQLRLVIYEKDQLHICNYEKIEKLLEKHGFYLVESKDNNFIWEK